MGRWQVHPFQPKYFRQREELKGGSTVYSPRGNPYLLGVKKENDAATGEMTATDEKQEEIQNEEPNATQVVVEAEGPSGFFPNLRQETCQQGAVKV